MDTESRGVLVFLLLFVWAASATGAAVGLYTERNEILKDANRNGWGEYALIERTGAIEFVWNKKEAE